VAEPTAPELDATVSQPVPTSTVPAVPTETMLPEPPGDEEPVMEPVMEEVPPEPTPAEPSPAPEPQPCHFELTLQTTGSTAMFGFNWAPNNYGALWVSDAQNGFIRTFELWAGRHINDLRQWASQTGSNQVDAISGATQSSHQTHTVTWDCRDLDGELLPYGSYVFHAEVTEGGQGPYMEIPFEIGTASADFTPPDQDGFLSIRLAYSPGAAQ
jgi:hypothetical protein